MEQPPTLWVVQSNLGNDQTCATIELACQRHGFKFMGVQVVPFAHDLPEVSHNGPVLFYGATQWIRKVAAAARWKPGVFFDEHLFTVSTCLSKWPGHILNDDAVVLNIDSVAVLPHAIDDKIFVRPDADFKEFSGCVMRYEELLGWADVLRSGGLELGGSLRIAVAHPKEVEMEWRVFAVEGAGIVDATQYRINGSLAVQHGAPAKVLEFAAARLSEWMPVPALALDIALSEGELRIIELSDIHSAGHYAADVEKIVVAISRAAERHFRSATR